MNGNPNYWYVSGKCSRLTCVVVHRGLDVNLWYIFYFQRIHTGGDVHSVILENLNDCVVLVAVKTSGATTRRQTIIWRYFFMFTKAWKIRCLLMFTVPWRSVSGRWGRPPQPWQNIPQQWIWADAAWPQNGWPQQETTSCLPPRKRNQESRRKHLYI